MINYGIQRGSVKPPEVEITATAVFVASNITPYTYEFDEDQIIEGFEYNYVCYTKDEYLLKLAQDNAALKQDLIDTQLALCELYEEGGYE